MVLRFLFEADIILEDQTMEIGVMEGSYSCNRIISVAFELSKAQAAGEAEYAAAITGEKQQ